MSKRLLYWIGGLLMLVGVLTAIVFLAWPTPGPPHRSIAYVGPPSWHDTGVRVGFALTVLGVVPLLITQLMRSESED